MPTIRSYSETFGTKHVPTVTKPSARRSIRQILAACILPAFGHRRVDEMRQEYIDEFVGAQKARGFAPKTINNRLAVLSRLLRYAHENGVTPPPATPLRFKIAGLAPETVAVPLDDVERLLTAATDEHDRAAVLLATEAGLRAG